MSTFTLATPKVPYLIPVKQETGFSFVELEALDWPELDDIFAKQVTGPLCFLPPELFLETHFLHACRRAKVPAVIGSVYDLSWVIEATSYTTCDTIVTTEAVWTYLRRDLEKHNLLEAVKTVVYITTEATESQDEGDQQYTQHYLPHPLS